MFNLDLGRFMCLGSAQHIKSRFGRGFLLEVSVTLPSVEEVNELLEDAGFHEGLEYQDDELIKVRSFYRSGK